MSVNPEKSGVELSKLQFHTERNLQYLDYAIERWKEDPSEENMALVLFYTEEATRTIERRFTAIAERLREAREATNG